MEKLQSKLDIIPIKTIKLPLLIGTKKWRTGFF